ncbi:hypothetical protein BDA96_06G049300 [Sorghum bicolor]|uniref:Uncharacterized protein n=2 Tax=Sorghum bicolor TaxID=4558 RepID=A0A921UCC4_SORBI|nr:uncharacterized protein LOC110436597 [Sorghum bicolor]KAG0525356.1 hypothetical protein BDA96_06G049300 [Sorghum bicolor]OQU81343.1 hypothetical protein SORBI_3006G045100 [Sorghum bicolor]|eukprot:XP_021319648.1 uncharacterized protein LOC110436597 [Sorghum bicolor]
MWARVWQSLNGGYRCAGSGVAELQRRQGLRASTHGQIGGGGALPDLPGPPWSPAHQCPGRRWRRSYSRWSLKGGIKKSFQHSCGKKRENSAVACLIVVLCSSVINGEFVQENWQDAREYSELQMVPTIRSCCHWRMFSFMQVPVEATKASNLLKYGHMYKTSVDGYLTEVAKDPSRSVYNGFVLKLLCKSCRPNGTRCMHIVNFYLKYIWHLGRVKSCI